MNESAVNAAPIADVQGSPDARNIPINWVGIKDIRYPFRFADVNQAPQSTWGTFAMHVSLPAHQKGTHMSRFVAVLENLRIQNRLLTLHSFQELAHEMRQCLQADAARIQLDFHYFREKTAPVSGVNSLMDYAVRLSTEQHLHQDPITRIRVIVPTTSLCPCSKMISDYGAHNQRSHLTLDVHAPTDFSVERLISIAEQEASSELYGLLKRPDEKFVTERAHDNPKFVEDMVRDIAQRLCDQPEIFHFRIESENFESIHNHSAHAIIEHSM